MKAENILLRTLGDLRAILGTLGHVPDDADIRSVPVNPGFAMFQVSWDDEHPTVNREIN
jgi:hypothetical protein